MHFHLPKPLHGWREFLGEVGIIVIGVLIALGAERLMHEIESRRIASAAQSRIREEMGNSMLLLVERVAVQQCLRNRLSALGHGLASGTTDWSGFILAPRPGFALTAFREVYRTPSRIWLQDAYHETLAQGDLNSVDPDRRAEIASAYKQIDGDAQMNETETDLSTRLAALQFNRKLSDTERDQLLATVMRLDWINALMVVSAQQEFSKFRDLGYQLSPTELADARKYWPIKLNELRDKYGSCVDASAIGEFDPRLVSIR